MNQTILIEITQDELKDLFKETLKEEMKGYMEEIDEIVNGRLVSPQEAMKLLNIKSYNTIKKMWENKSIQMVQVSGKPKITRKSVQKLIK